MTLELPATVLVELVVVVAVVAVELFSPRSIRHTVRACLALIVRKKGNDNSYLHPTKISLVTASKGSYGLFDFSIKGQRSNTISRSF